MKIVLADASFLKDSISIIADLVNEARFKLTKEGIELKAMDPANVAMVVFKLLSSSFTEYELEKEQELGVNLQSLKQVLRRATPRDTLTLDASENKLRIQLRGASTRTFSLPIIEMDEREQREPNLTFTTTINMPSSMLVDAIDDADIVAESVTLRCEPEKFTIDAQGDQSNAKIELKSGDKVKIKSTVKADVKAKYSIEYLKKMITGSKLSDNAELHMSQDYPLKLEYKVIDRLQLSFILAPRIENE